MAMPKLLLVLTENWTLVPPRDMRALVRVAVEAEQAGIDGVMLSEHTVLGPAGVTADSATRTNRPTPERSTMFHRGAGRLQSRGSGLGYSSVPDPSVAEQAAG